MLTMQGWCFLAPFYPGISPCWAWCKKEILLAPKLKEEAFFCSSILFIITIIPGTVYTLGRFFCGIDPATTSGRIQILIMKNRYTAAFNWSYSKWEAMAILTRRLAFKPF
jgi:hypothetical protein